MEVYAKPQRLVLCIRGNIDIWNDARRVNLAVDTLYVRPQSLNHAINKVGSATLDQRGNRFKILLHLPVLISFPL